MVFWQSARTRSQARPNVSLPTARASGVESLEIIVDSHERYAWKFSHQQATTVRRALHAGDYAVEHDGRILAGVERKSLADLVATITGGKLWYLLAGLASLERAAVVVEDRYSKLFKLDRVRPAVIADTLGEAAVRYPSVPIVFCETRSLAQEWTYRFLGAAVAEHRRTAAPPAPTRSPIGCRRRATNSPSWNRPRPRFEPGPAPAGSTCPSGEGSAPRSGPRTTEPTPPTPHSGRRRDCHAVWSDLSG